MRSTIEQSEGILTGAVFENLPTGVGYITEQ